MGNGDQLERAFAGATVHDIFNVLAVAILFPIEVGTHYLYHLTKALLPAETKSGDSWDGPVKKIVAPLSNLVLIANKNLMTDVANGVRTCESYYPVTCEGNVESYATCNFGLIACDKKTNKCPIFFQNGATKKDDSVSGGVCLVLALVIIIVCLIGLVSLLQRMLKESSSRIIYKATNINGKRLVPVTVHTYSCTPSSLCLRASLVYISANTIFFLLLIFFSFYMYYLRMQFILPC